MAGPVGAMPRIVGRGMSLAVSRGDLPGSSFRCLRGRPPCPGLHIPFASRSSCRSAFHERSAASLHLRGRSSAGLDWHGHARCEGWHCLARCESGGGRVAREQQRAARRGESVRQESQCTAAERRLV
eukprot:scaffold5487_cov67-Phaeocystis_antarctica.AAC.1